ncbi:unnamed protein product [Miscanthus lutarioriparius]|uniref:Uncharacterized protein n=1 Tax=Miscanthus lutarioriparius TaxID=422564 RepID=A0A811QG00_9POAL|nr:unnamed protein product [Miscanthus lutarioriparius]
MADLVLGLAKSAVKETANLAKSAIEDEKKLRKSVQRDLILISDEFEMMHSFLNVSKEHVADDDMATTAVKQLLKARVEAMGQRNLRYSRIGDGNSGSNKSAEQKLHQPVYNALLPRSATAREATKERIWPVELVNLISRNEKGVGGVLQVISVLGTVGMMSVVKRAYDDPETRGNFRCRAWVKLVHPFNPLDFIRGLVAQFCRSGNSISRDEESSSTIVVDSVVEMTTVATQGVLIDEFMKLVSHHKYLVVLQGVSTMEDWETVRVYLPDNNNGSCIIVNTHQFEVASLCVGPPHRVLELEKLSAHHSVYVLVKEDMIGQVEQQTMGPDTAHDEYALLGPQADFCSRLSMSVTSTGVHSVWEMSGVGKSFLVKHYYIGQEAKMKNTTSLGVRRGSLLTYGWVNVSRPFDLTDLSWRLLLDLNPGFLQDCQLSTMKDPIEECRQYLYVNDCFIVIDGLQTRKEWDLIKGALGLETTTRHVIFVITNEESVAKYCATDIESVYNVKGLGADHAFQLLKQTHRHDEHTWTEEEELHMLHKFGGLPKVICAVAMRYKSLLWDILRKDNLVSLLEADTRLEDLFSWLLAYFHSCPDFLKPCIFYLSIFPLNHAIRRRRLVRRWIAEGYSRETKEYTEEERGEMYFSTLTDLSMIQVPGTTSTTLQEDSSKKIPLCQANGFLREYIISRSMEENLVFALDGHCRRNLRRTGRHLAIDKSWDRDRNVFESVDFSLLRSLTVFGEWKPFFVSEKMKLLRVLDLEDASSGVTDGDVAQMVKLLPRLKFLSLRRCRQVTNLPDSIGDRLKQLQTLDIRETSVTKLPKSIINLDKLQYIRAGTVTGHHYQATETTEAAENLQACGVKVPRGIWKLFDLHTLGVVDVGATGGGDAIVEELKKLTQLHKLGVCSINRNNIRSGPASELDEDDDEDEAGWLDDISSLPVKLRSLKLYGLVRKIPVWTKELKELRKLSLQMTMLPQEGIDDLPCSLDHLQSIRLFLSELHDGELHFGSRQIFLGLLDISFSPRVQAKITFHDNCYLKVLRIRCCGVSSLQFSGLQSLRALEEVWLRSPYNDGLKQHLDQELDCRPEAVLRPDKPGSWIPWLLTSS